MRLIDRCIVCGEDRIREVYPSSFEGSWEEARKYFLTNRLKAVHGGISRCDTCGFTFTNPQFDKETYARIYGSIGPEADFGKSSINRYTRLCKVVRKYVTHGSLLDLGCADGAFLTFMDGFDTCGLDIRHRSPVIAGDHGIISGNFVELTQCNSRLGRNKFDVVTAWDFFEHIPDIEESTEAVARVLKPGGWLMCSLPNISSLAARLSGKWWNLFLLEHLWYFSPAAYTRFVQQFGFKVESVKPMWYSVDLRTTLDRLNQTSGFKLPSQRLGRIGDITFNLPIGIMLVICRRIR